MALCCEYFAGPIPKQTMTIDHTELENSEKYRSNVSKLRINI